MDGIRVAIKYEIMFLEIRGGESAVHGPKHFPFSIVVCTPSGNIAYTGCIIYFYVYKFRTILRYKIPPSAENYQYIQCSSYVFNILQGWVPIRY